MMKLMMIRIACCVEAIQSFHHPGGRCVGCPDGMVCEEGSDEQFFPCAEVDIVNSTVNPYPKPDEGYFVLLQQPTYVFKCIDLLSCPGGQAENCGAGLRGIACGACDAGYYKQAGAMALTPPQTPCPTPCPTLVRS